MVTIQGLRWNAVVVYKTKNGPVDVEHHFEELYELDDLIERGPDYRAIVSISIRYAPSEPITIEEAETE